MDPVLEAYRKGQEPPKELTVDQWADQYRFVNETTGEKWNTRRVEVARGPMKAVTEPGVRTISVMSCTQLMKTELLLNTVGFFMHLDPCPMLVVQPKDDVVKKFSNTRVKQMIRSTPVLRNLVTEKNRREATDTTAFKEFPGGHLTMVSARSPSNLAMLPIRVVLLDEIDKYEADAGGEGDPVDLAEERMSTFSSNSLSIRVCSPTSKGISRIEQSYEESDQRKPFVRCPHCDHFQIMRWANVQWEKDDAGTPLPDTTRYYCEGCGAGWDEAERLRALKKIYWRQMKPFTCRSCGEHNNPELWDSQEEAAWDEHGRALCKCGAHGPNHHAGFWASKLYSPFRPLSELVVKWIEAQGNIERLKTFINTQLAETFEETGERIEGIDSLLARRERFEAPLPDGVGVITAGVDVQNDRIELEIVGWGVDEESWSLNYLVIPGDPSQPEIWRRLDEELNRAYVRADKRLSYVAAAAVDMGGGFTQEVANYCRARIARRIWPIRGMGGDGRAYPVWPKNPNSTTNTRVPYYNVGVDAAKNTVYSRLLLGKEGAGYCHFPLEREASWFKGLTSEKRVLRYRGTQKFFRWENPQRLRNEPFDCRVYAYAALCGLQSMGWRVNMITAEQKLIMDAMFDERRQSSLQERRTQGENLKKAVEHNTPSSPGPLARGSSQKPRSSRRSGFMDK